MGTRNLTIVRDENLLFGQYGQWDGYPSGNGLEVLMQIAEHNSFKALNKADATYGHYLVNSDKRLWLKYATAADGPWSFTFHPSDLAAIASDLKLKGETFVVLACGHHSVACLNQEQFEGLIELNSSSPQWMKVDAPAGKQMRVTGSNSGKEPVLIPHNSFPNCIF